MKWLFVVLLLVISVSVFGDAIHCVVTDITDYYIQCRDIRTEIYYAVFTWNELMDVRIGYEVLIVEIGFQRYEIREILY